MTSIRTSTKICCTGAKSRACIDEPRQRTKRFDVADLRARGCSDGSQWAKTDALYPSWLAARRSWCRLGRFSSSSKSIRRFAYCHILSESVDAPDCRRYFASRDTGRGTIAHFRHGRFGLCLVFATAASVMVVGYLKYQGII